MTLDQLKTYLLAKPAVSEEVPFGPGVWVYKVMGKVFALVPWDAPPPQVSLKCNPVRAIELRQVYPAVQPGYHLNKKHWNTVTIDGSIEEAEILWMVDHSYDLVVASLTRQQKRELAELT